MKKMWIMGWLFRAHWDKKGFWITDTKGFRNRMVLAFTSVSDEENHLVWRIVAWRLMIEWGRKFDP